MTQRRRIGTILCVAVAASCGFVVSAYVVLLPRWERADDLEERLWRTESQIDPPLISGSVVEVGFEEPDLLVCLIEIRARKPIWIFKEDISGYNPRHFFGLRNEENLILLQQHWGLHISYGGDERGHPLLLSPESPPVVVGKIGDLEPLNGAADPAMTTSIMLDMRGFRRPLPLKQIPPGTYDLILPVALKYFLDKPGPHDTGATRVQIVVEAPDALVVPEAWP